MMTVLLTTLTATIGVSVVFGVWLVVDQMSRKRFGERPTGCGGHGGAKPGEGCGQCGMKENCDEDECN